MGDLFYINDNTGLENLIPYKEKAANDSNWIYFKLTSDTDCELFCGKNEENIYQFIVSKKYKNWVYRVMDFVSYIKSSKINGIITIEKDEMKYAEKCYMGHHYRDNQLREYECKVLIHSAPLNAWKSIQKDNCLKSWHVLFQEGYIVNKNPIGELLGDPNEFSDYVMLGSGTTSEIVVSSSDKKEINCDINVSYEPGARLYLDANKLAQDGKLIRDGGHIKVKDRLELEKYLLFIATSETVDKKEKHWTPKKFTDKADRVFTKKHGFKPNKCFL